MSGYRTWIEVDKNKIANNVRAVNKYIDDKCIRIGVVKGNALGMGTVPYALTLQELGVEWLGVTRVDDAIKLREAYITIPILMLCEDVENNWVKRGIENRLRFTVSHLGTAYELSETAKKMSERIKIHIKVNCGLNRLGFRAKDLLSYLIEIKKIPYIDIEGIFTQLSPAHSYQSEKVLSELKRFEEAIRDAEVEGFSFRYRHAATTPTVLSRNIIQMDMVRIGIGYCGIYPSECFASDEELMFPMTWKTKICSLNHVVAGETIGYDDLFQCNEDKLLAVLPVGISDGLSERLQDGGSVLIKGMELKVIAVTMNHTIIDAGKNNQSIHIGDEVVLWGEHQGISLNPDIIAKRSKIYVEEMLAHINPEIPRIYND